MAPAAAPDRAQTPKTHARVAVCGPLEPPESHFRPVHPQRAPSWLGPPQSPTSAKSPEKKATSQHTALAHWAPPAHLGCGLKHGIAYLMTLGVHPQPRSGAGPCGTWCCGAGRWAGRPASAVAPPAAKDDTNGSPERGRRAPTD